jgi:hypothetical protein
VQGSAGSGLVLHREERPDELRLLWSCPDIVSSFSYIKEMDENITGDLEALTIRTIGG